MAEGAEIWPVCPQESEMPVVAGCRAMDCTALVSGPYPSPLQKFPTWVLQPAIERPTGREKTNKAMRARNRCMKPPRPREGTRTVFPTESVEQSLFRRKGSKDVCIKSGAQSYAPHRAQSTGLTAQGTEHRDQRLRVSDPEK